MSQVYTRPVKELGREEWWEFVAITGYLRFAPAVFSQNRHLPHRGVGPVTAAGQLLRAVHHVDTGWSELLIGPEESPLIVWVEPDGVIEVTPK